MLLSSCQNAEQLKVKSKVNEKLRNSQIEFTSEGLGGILNFLAKFFSWEFLPDSSTTPNYI